MATIPDQRPVDFNAAINSLPQWLRDYIHDLASRSDPAGDIKTIHELRENVRVLEAKIVDLKNLR
jgi:hypothetical protein